MPQGAQANRLHPTPNCCTEAGWSGCRIHTPCSVLTRPSRSCLRAASSDMAYTALTPRDAISCVTSFASPSSPLNASCSSASKGFRVQHCPVHRAKNKVLTLSAA